MEKYLHPHSPWRIFFVSGLITVASILGVLFGYGIEAMVLTLVLIAVELAFSFDNAVVNAKVLSKMSNFWQLMFLTIGAAVAIFGMRLVFPIILVAITAGLGWSEVLDLALNHPVEYSHALHESHVQLASFAGAFLMMLALHFFVDDSRDVYWLEGVERRIQKFSDWLPGIATGVLIVVAAFLPMNHARNETLVAGFIGVASYVLIHAFTKYFGKLGSSNRKNSAKLTGMAGFLSFLYLQVLDTTFSFDGVLGAFAITGDVILIAIGLGVGALWVRSLTVFMVRRGTLDTMLYIEHGAYYAIGILAVLMLVSVLVSVPDVIAGLAGVGVITASIIASRQALAAKHGPRQG